MRVAIVGSRSCKNYDKDEMMRRVPPETTLIISGGAVGIDSLAETLANERGISFRKILPNYAAYGKSAPIVRNEEIVRGADLVLAFWDFHSRGTASAIACCIERGVPVEIIGIDGCD